MRIPALDETLDDLFLHRAPQPPRFAKFPAMPHRALPQRACARVARLLRMDLEILEYLSRTT